MILLTLIAFVFLFASGVASYSDIQDDYIGGPSEEAMSDFLARHF